MNSQESLMDIRTYQARSLQEALAMVRRDLGPEASILETRSGPRGFFRWFRRSTTVQVVASNTIHVPSRLAEPDSGCQPSQERVVTHSEQPVMLDEGPSLVADLCQEHATSSGLGNSELACQLMHGISQQGIPNQEFQELLQRIDPLDQDAENLSVMYQRLADQLARTIPVGGTIQPGQGGQTTVATVGPSGTGKTINLAKLAAQFQMHQQCQVGLIATDMSRLTSVDQLRSYAEMFQLPLEVVATAREMRRARQKFTGLDLVLVDTAGVRPADLAAIRTLRTLLVEAGCDEIMLVLNANSSHDSMQEAVEGFGTVGITSLMLTKFDEATRLGQLLPLLQQSYLPVSYVSDGQGIPQDLQPAEAGWLARRLLGCRLTDGLARGQSTQPEDNLASGARTLL